MIFHTVEYVNGRTKGLYGCLRWGLHQPEPRRAAESGGCAVTLGITHLYRLAEGLQAPLHSGYEPYFG
jgi:hypothetical protein